MATIKILLIAIDVIVCFLLVGAILLQRNNGNGMGAAFGGSGEAIFGAQVGNVLTKATVILGTLFLVITLALSMIIAHGSEAGSSLMNNAPAPAPAAPALPDAPALPADGAL